MEPKPARPNAAAAMTPAAMTEAEFRQRFARRAGRGDVLQSWKSRLEHGTFPAADDAARQERARREKIAGRLRVLGDQLGARYTAERVALEKFACYHERQSAVVAQLRGLAAATDSFRQSPPGIIFFGAVGTGKDHLLAHLLYVAAGAGVHAEWVNGQEIFGKFRDRITGRHTEEGLLRALEQPDILGISDPLPVSGEASSFNLAQFHRLVDRRYRALKATWLTANFESEEEANECLAVPTMDRLCEGAVMIRCFWPSFRTRSKQRTS